MAKAKGNAVIAYTRTADEPERPSFAVRKTAFRHLKDGLLQAKKPSFTTRLTISRLHAWPATPRKRMRTGRPALIRPPQKASGGSWAQGKIRAWSAGRYAPGNSKIKTLFIRFILHSYVFCLILHRKTEIQNFYGRLSRGKDELVK